jgi:hypothetical protein
LNTNSHAFQSAITQITLESLAMLSTISLSQSKTTRSTESLAVSGPIVLPVPHWPDSITFAKQIAAELDQLVTQLSVHQKTIAGLIAAAEAA